MRAFLATGAALAACLGSAHAQSLTTPLPGYVYFNMPGATVADHQDAMLACRDRIAGISQPDTSAGAGAGGGLLGALVVGIIKGIQEGMEERRGYVANMENCMVGHGWRIVQVSDVEGKEISDLPDVAARQERMKDWFGAETPHGKIVRTFGNEIAVGAFRPGMAGDLDKMPLSLLAIEIPKPPEPKPAEATPVKATVDAAAPKPPKYPKPARPLKPADLSGVKADQAYMVVRVTGPGVASTNVAFARLSADEKKPAWYDGQPDSAIVGNSAPTVRSKVEKLSIEDYVIPVAPGRWAMTGFREGLFFANLCFGRPTFEVKPGEVVFAGAFATEAGGYPIDLNLETAKKILAGSPDLAARVTSASYTNGDSVKFCWGSSAYAYEVPGAPFAETYKAGAMAPKAFQHAVVEKPAEPAAAAPEATPAIGAPPAAAPAATVEASAPATPPHEAEAVVPKN